MDDYNTATEERRGQFETLRKKDSHNAKVIETQTSKLLHLQDSVTSLKAKLQASNMEMEGRNRALKEKKDRVQLDFQEMKRQMAGYRQSERENLKDLARTSNRVMQALKQKVVLAEDILRLAELNKKLETDSERFMAFEGDTDLIQELDQASPSK
jgi:hypothetical protein